MAAKKKAVSTRVSADRKEAEGRVGLQKLGKYLSGSDVAPAARAKTTAERRKNLTNAVYTSRGGGQGKASPMASKFSAPKGWASKAKAKNVKDPRKKK